MEKMEKMKQLERDAIALIRAGTFSGDAEALELGEKLVVALHQTR